MLPSFRNLNAKDLLQGTKFPHSKSDRHDDRCCCLFHFHNQYFYRPYDTPALPPKARGKNFFFNQTPSLAVSKATCFHLQ